MSNFILTDRKTDYLLPPSVDAWLTQDHLARFVVEVIDGLDLSNLTRQYAGRGSKAHHPATQPPCWPFWSMLWLLNWCGVLRTFLPLRTVSGGGTG
jgi:hypothetical protein